MERLIEVMRHIIVPKYGVYMKILLQHWDCCNLFYVHLNVCDRNEYKHGNQRRARLLDILEWELLNWEGYHLCYGYMASGRWAVSFDGIVDMNYSLRFCAFFFINHVSKLIMCSLELLSCIYVAHSASYITAI